MKYLTAKSHRVTASFNYINWQDLVHKIKNPPNFGRTSSNDVKKRSAIIAATDAPNKTKETVLKHDRFTLLRLDLDETKLSVEAVTGKLKATGIDSFIIHTTASHRQGNGCNRYRVYIELASVVVYSTWATIQTYLNCIFSADDCSSRPQQIMYLPARFVDDSYEYFIGEGQALEIHDSPLLANALVLKRKQQEQAISVSNILPIKPLYQEKLVGAQVSIINATNEHYDWDNLLIAYGYKHQGKAYLPPESTSSIAGVYILTSNTDGRQRYYSHHANDPCATGFCLDKFDFIAIRDFNGDAKLAIKILAKTYFPKLDKHNKKEWSVCRHNAQLSSSFMEKR
jgi:hypothetical protein